MAEQKTYSKIGKTYRPISDITVAPIRLASQDISNWVTAVNSARDVRMPRRRLLIELQDNIKLDGKVKTVTSKGLASILNKEFCCVSKTEKGKRITRIHQELIDRPLFDKLLEYLYLEERGYGHVLIEAVPGVQYPIDDFLMIPHANVAPEKGLILPNYMDAENGILFRGPDADPFCKKFIFEFGGTKNLGLFMEIAQYVIYKRGGFGDWAQFSELFGMPFRVGKYNPTDPNSRKLLDQALKIMGGAGYAIIPEGTELDFHQTNYGSGQAGIFKDLIQACNDEIAQMWLGGTMTTEDGSSKSQGEVHERGENEITAAALKRILKFLNGPFGARLIEHFGYSELKNAEFIVESPDLISLKDRITIDVELNNIIEIDPSYFYDKYQVTPPKTGPAAKLPPKNDIKDEDQEGNKPPQKKKTKLNISPEVKAKLSISRKINDFYSNATCTTCVIPNALEKLKAQAEGVENILELLEREKGVRLSFEDDINRLAKLIFNGKLKPGSVDKTLIKKTALKLMEGIMSGYRRKPSDFTEQDKELIKKMEENIFIFSGFKTEKMLRAASDLLLDDDGSIRPYNEFKEKFLELDATYNKTHLSVEYDFAVAQSQMGSKVIQWAELGDDFPNRIYRTAGDARVRPAHEVLNGLILAGNDPRVDEIMPVKDFGCRCDMDATDEPVNDGNYVINTSKLGPFKGNVVKNGIVFPENHPYYEASKAAAKRIIDIAKSLI